MTTIPAGADDITSSWLTDALRETDTLPGQTTIDQFSIEPVGEELGYLSFLYRVRPTYSSSDKDLPSTLIVKFPSTDEGSRMTGNALRAFERESLFYKNCSHESPCAPPKHYYSYSDPAADEYILVMEDLEGCTFINQADGVTREDALNCFRTMADHHALYWEQTDHMDWLPPFSEFGQLYKPLLDAGAPLIQQNWGDTLVPIYTDHVDVALEKYATITAELQSRPTTLVHCDPRIENIAFENGVPRFYDWQLASRGPAAYDLMYFFKQSMDVEQRRECQDELFDAYLQVLSDNGVQYSIEELMEDMSLACCTIWSFTAMIGNFFVRNEVNEHLWGVTMPRFMSMIEDFDAVDRLKRL
jgi:thiamine kinase-like enzyme